nr:MAG TPA: Cytosine specific methyltransferase [Caudoviricetes sp.]
MKVLIACECSQTVCKEFRALGHEAYSCDIEPCHGGYLEWHIVGNCLDIINGSVSFMTEDGINHSIDTEWDLIIAHPPCTYLSNAATRSHSLKGASLEDINKRTEKRIQAQEFFMRFANVNCDKVVIENPVGVMSTVYRRPDQIIEPYQFAESEDDKENYVTKRTCLWLKGLKPLRTNDLPKPDNAKMYGRWSNGKAGCWHEVQGQKSKSTVRSKTFEGIAKAMAEQWGDI